MCIRAVLEMNHGDSRFGRVLVIQERGTNHSNSTGTKKVSRRNGRANQLLNERYDDSYSSLNMIHS